MAKKKKGYLPVEKLENAIYQWFKNHPQHPIATKQLAQYVKLNPENSIEFGRVLDRLLSKGVIVRAQHKRYKLAPAQYNHPSGEGIIMMSRSGFASVTVEGQPDDIYISVNKLHGALNGDRVKLSLTPSNTKKRSVEGEVIAILERSKRPYIGIVQISGKQI